MEGKYQLVVGVLLTVLRATSVLCVSSQNSTLSTFIMPSDITEIEIAPNDSYTLSYSIRYTQDRSYLVKYRFNGRVIERDSNYERDENYFSSTYRDCCSQPEETCRELQLTVNGVDFVHGGTISLVVFEFDHNTGRVDEVDSSHDIPVFVVDVPTTVTVSTTEMGTPPSSAGTTTAIETDVPSAPTVLPRENRMDRVNGGDEWPQYVGFAAAGSLLVALVTVTSVLVATYCLLTKEIDSLRMKRGHTPSGHELFEKDLQ